MIVEPDPFPELTRLDIIDGTATSFAWNIDDIAVLSSNAYCGPFVVEFKDASTNEAIGTPIFSDTRTADSSDHFFEVSGTTGRSDIGTYSFFYNVKLEFYSNVDPGISQTF